MSDTLVYLYGIVATDAPSPPEDLEGIDGRSVTLRRVGDVAAVLSEVPADEYGDDALNARLDDLTWVGDRGLAHERVLDWFAQAGPVIPLSLFSLHRDLQRVDERVGAEAQSFARLLDRLRGKREWGVKLWRRESAAREGIDSISASLRQLGREIEEAPPGKRFLLEKKRETMRTEELRAASKRIAHELFATLKRAADAAVSIPLPSVPSAERVLLLHAAFLVADDAFPAFQSALGEQASRLEGTGFEIEFTGPWPPYHFTTAEEE